MGTTNSIWSNTMVLDPFRSIFISYKAQTTNDKAKTTNTHQVSPTWHPHSFVASAAHPAHRTPCLLTFIQANNLHSFRIWFLLPCCAHQLLVLISVPLSRLMTNTLFKFDRRCWFLRGELKSITSLPFCMSSGALAFLPLLSPTSFYCIMFVCCLGWSYNPSRHLA